jgi:hypothetical protein
MAGRGSGTNARPALEEDRSGSRYENGAFVRDMIREHHKLYSRSASIVAAIPATLRSLSRFPPACRVIAAHPSVN